MKQVYKVSLLECDCSDLEFEIFETLEEAIEDLQECLYESKCKKCKGIRLELTTHFVEEDEEDGNNYDREEAKTLFYYSDNK